ncbi:MAG: beta-N-acetylhexosaminidase [Prevotella sp.]
MKKLILTLTCTLWATAMLAAVSVIPLPNKCTERKGNFRVNEKTTISLSTDTEEMRNAVAVLNDRFGKAAGFRLGVSTTAHTSNVIRCLLNPKMKAESYTLTVSPKTVKITAGSAKGIFYAMQTLRQLLPAAIESESCATGNSTWNIPCVEIEDAPTFGYRGVMLDVSRHFIPKEDMKRHIDMLAFHKLNVLHWHLTDDQGWRIEIKKYPKLTSVGGFRKKTIRGYMWDNPTEWDTQRYGGFYTQEDVKEIVAYAQQRFVEIIPEIEMPGHSVAALTAYPEYSCCGGPFEVEGRWGIFNDIYCTKEATFTFIQDILDEVCQLFPSQYIHLGGDEAPRIRWKNCVHCQERMQKEHLTKEAELQTYFMNRIEKYLSGKGKRIIGWDEILEGGIPQRATVMSWRGEKGGITAAKAGYDVIMSPNVYTYFNCHQSKTQERKIGAPKRVITIEKVYNYYPIPQVLSAEEGKHIVGIQANLWTEYLSTLGDMEYMLHPRVAALAETGWTKKERKDYARFCQRLSLLSQRYDLMGIDYCKEDINR